MVVMMVVGVRKWVRVALFAPSSRELNKLKMAHQMNVSWEQIVSVGLDSNLPPLKSGTLLNRRTRSRTSIDDIVPSPMKSPGDGSLNEYCCCDTVISISHCDTSMLSTCKCVNFDISNRRISWCYARTCCWLRWITWACSRRKYGRDC